MKRVANRNAVSNTLPELGVGITYSSELNPLIEGGLVDYIEIEPQTLWMHSAGEYKMPQQIVDHLNGFPLPKLIHSVGLPVGGTFRGDLKQIDLLNKNIKQFKAPWASEHLGFNATSKFHTGFFLPPQQTEKGIQRAVQSIQFLQSQLPVPFAVETGVNYLKPKQNEIPDGEFISRIIAEAGCGLLLDLHNLYTNEFNGRQTIKDFIQQIPLDQVWEVHLAGGIKMDGFWLDAHSGNMPMELIEIAYDLVEKLPNLKAITYEILPSYLPVVGLKKIEREIEVVKKIWEKKTKSSVLHVAKAIESKVLYAIPQDSEWEETLGALAIGKRPPANSLQQDPGIPVLQKLVQEFRGSMVVSVFKLTSRFLMLTLGTDTFKLILKNFWDDYPPQQFASDEALNFAIFLRNLDLKIPNLASLLEFEESTLLTLLDNEPRIVTFDHDPFPLFKSLNEGKLETMNRQKGNYEIEITGDIKENKLWKTA